MNIKIISGRLSFTNHRTPYVAEPNEQGVVKRSWVANMICVDETPFLYNGKTYEQTMVEYEENGKRHITPYTEFNAKVMPLVWAEKGVPTPKVPYLNYAFNRADATVGMRGPKIDSKTGDYYAGYEPDTWYFYGKTDADKTPVAPLVVDQNRAPLPAESGHPVSGDFVVVLISIYVFGKGNKMGVSASYNGMQYLREGEAFGATRATSESFDEQEAEVGSEEGSDCF